MLSQSTLTLRGDILNYLHNFQYHTIKCFDLFSKKYTKIYSDFEDFLHKILTVFDNCNENELAELKRLLEIISTSVDEQIRSIDKQRESLESLSSLLKNSNYSKILDDLKAYINDMYYDAAKNAILSNNIPMLKELLEKKELDKDDRSCLLHKACENNKEEAVDVLLTSPDININYRKFSITPLWIAVEKRFINIVKILKKYHELDPDLPNTGFKSSPLHVAVKQSNIEMVKELISIKNIDLDIVDMKSKQTPLDRAFNQQNIPLIELLLNAGADPRLCVIPESKIQDINSLLQPSLQECLIKSMIELGYISNKGGVCNPFSKVVRLSALSKTLPQLFQLLFAIRKLKLHEYNISLKTETTILQPYHIYITKGEDVLKYQLLSPQGEIITDEYKLKIPDENKLNDDFLQSILPGILTHTSSKGHTQVSDLKTMELKHDQLIKNAEQAALHALEVKNETDLTESEKVTFRKLALIKTKELRERLSTDELEKENLYIQIKSLFDSMDLIRNSKAYPSYLPNKYMHIGNKKAEKYITQLINPIFFQKEHKEILLKRFNGCYHKDELPYYFDLLRNLIRKAKCVDEPIILHLSSPDHTFIVIYEKTTDLWYFYDINQFARNEAELKYFEFADNKEIATRVNNNFCPNSLHAIFETAVYTVIENAHSKPDTWNYFTSVWGKDEEVRNKKQALKVLINEWYALLSA
ncbi:MAG: ankyrin repeat domain-containing protein, partial [Gammaproteobacteria bacterium]|nr:ankyrin repeat domain-containing protein [Gammaproteobacteria bacterium]